MHLRARAFIFGLTLSSSLLVLSTSPPLAHAQDDATTVEARKRFLEGVKLFDDKKYDLARAAFLQAYALRKHPDVLLNLAQSELMSGKPLDAVDHFKEFLRNQSNDKHPRHGDAVRGLDEARQKIGRLQIRVDQSDAEVFIDGKKVGMSPLSEPLDVTPGQHDVEARKGGKTATQTVGAVDGKIQIVTLVLPSIPTVVTTTTEPPPDKGVLVTPQPSDQPGGQREPFMRWAGHSPVAYVGAGIAAVGLGIGIGFAIASNSTQNNSDQLVSDISRRAATDEGLINYQGTGRNRFGSPCAPPVAMTTTDYSKACSNLRANLDDTNRNRTIMTVGFVATGVGVATLIGGYFLTAPRSDSAGLTVPRFAVTPLLGPETRGLGLAGSF